MKADKPISMWPGTVILQCPPCSWGKCVFCGYSSHCLVEVQPSTDNFIKQLDSCLEKHRNEEYLEIYNSGSFLDDRQISRLSRIAIFRKLADVGLKGVTIESRPEYIRKEVLTDLTKEFKGDLVVAIRLELADDSLLRKLKKGFSLSDVERACSVLAGEGVYSRSYILVGPPFVSDSKASALDSVKFAKEVGFTEITLLAAYPMRGSEGYQLWKSREWSPIRLDEFERIAALVEEMVTNVDHSCDGLKKFWRCENEKDT